MNRTTSVLIAVAVAAIAFAFTLFGQPDGVLTPPDDIFPVFAVLVLIEAITLGVGAAFVIRNRARLFGPSVPPFTRALYAAAAYLLLAPWPHDQLHRFADVNGQINWAGLAAIEYVFHLGIVPVGILFALLLRRSVAAEESRRGGDVARQRVAVS